MKFVMLENNILINPEDITAIKENIHYENNGQKIISGCTITFKNGKEIHTIRSLMDLSNLIQAAKL